MEKTYTLTGSLTTGYHHGSIGNEWMNVVRANRSACRVGFDEDDNDNVTAVLFDASLLASLRSKTVKSIMLTIRMSGVDMLFPGKILLGYKYNGSPGVVGTYNNDFARSDADSTSILAYTLKSISKDTASVIDGQNLTFDLSSGKVPKYGYVIGPTSAWSDWEEIYRVTLVIITDEPSAFIKVGGTWKEAVVWRKVGGTWVRGAIPYVKSGGAWRSS